MTEVPEHLLRRSRERRAALGLGGEAGEQGEAPAALEAPAVESAALEAAAPSPGGVAVIEEAPPVPEITVAPIPRRPQVPLFALLILVVLPVYAFVYMGAFGNRHPVSATDPLAVGDTIFHANCAVCHGANGEGGVGPALANVKKTFPNLADHLSWVHTGSAPFAGKVYGNSGRVATGGMPAFQGQLSDAQIADVVCYERVTFGGGATSADCPATAG